MKVSCRLLVSSLMAIALISAAAIAIILLAANVTMANAQQQQLTSQDSAIERGTTTSRSTRDSFRVQVPQGWVIHDVKNTGSALVAEVLDGAGILAQLCPEEEQQQVAFRSSGGNTSNSSISINSDRCQDDQEVIHVIRYPNLGARLGLTSDDIFAIINRDTIPNAILAYQIQKLQEVGYRNIQIVNSTDTTINVDISTGLNSNNNNNAIAGATTATTTTTVPAKLVAMTYSTNLAPNETRIGYFILTATAATPRNLGMITGYSIFYEGNSVAQTVSSSSLAPPPPPPPPTPFPVAARQVFASFELLAAPAEPLTIGITSSDTDGVAPATFDFGASVAGGAIPYTYSWDFGDGSVERDDDETVDHTFNIAGNYTVTVTVTDSTGRTVSDSIVVTVHERVPPTTEERMCDPSYPGLCIPPPPPDLDCDNISARNFRVLPPDQHRFDDDNDGIGCPTGSNQPNLDNNSGSDNLFDLDDFLDNLFDRLGLR
jgi:PKD repeat protein